MFEWPWLVHVRRYIGVAAAAYALLHFGMYVVDQKWNADVVAREIFERTYLTIGFGAVVILSVLALISTDTWHRRLKHNWKRLNTLVYPAAALALAHFFMQSKIDVGEATVAAGLFAWLMLWRLFSPGLRVTYPGLLLLAVVATLSALAFEMAWYGLLKHFDPIRILAANVTPDLAPRAVHKVFAAGMVVIVAVAIHRLASAIGQRWMTHRARSKISPC